jgi:hypothetical protein
MVAASMIARPARRASAPAQARDARLRLLISSGGDDRIWPDPVTRRNRYGAPPMPAPDELWFSSSTACAISPRGWAAASEALERLIDPGPFTITDWFDTLRERLVAFYGAPGCEAVLSASGTEAELLALAVGLSLAGGPLTNIVVAPAETGSGVPAAAEGRHFLGNASLGGVVARGQRITGWDGAEIRSETVEIRAACGLLRAPANVDQEVAHKVERAVASGDFVLLHVLDSSKTGRPGVSFAAAEQIIARYPGRVLAVVDACQLRCSAEAVRQALAGGMAVMLTGSKFAGGPAFCGALLLPAALCDHLARRAPAGEALAPYSAVLDWPRTLRRAFAGGLAMPANLGLGLRWTAALAEIDAFERLPAALRAAMLADFDRAVRERAKSDPQLQLLDPASPAAASGLTPIVHADGSDPRSVYEALARGEGGRRPVHLGQPVAIGERTALRVCASMPMITEAAERGLAALESDLDEVFESWASLRA